MDERYQTLSGQFEDLTKAKNELLRIVDRINDDSRRLFFETLEVVRGHFQQLFRDLFGGGRSRYRTGGRRKRVGKRDRNRCPTAGQGASQHLVAQRWRENDDLRRASCGDFRSRPSPFCVLDEVDAALDEANIGRFTGVLNEFLAWTQFIIISHSKKTMTCANSIYGVTMQESGISKQVSVSFRASATTATSVPPPLRKKQPKKFSVFGKCYYTTCYYLRSESYTENRKPKTIYDPFRISRNHQRTKKGAKAATWRLLFRVIETPYTWVVQFRNRRYDTGKTPIHSVEIPVISVGNLSVGGTGKTPMVYWITRTVRARGLRVAVISRGYGAEEGDSNDRSDGAGPAVARRAASGEPRSSRAAAQCAIEELEMQVILLDDAFQHRRIHRDLDIVLLDALEPFGFEHVFPRGTLREPLAGLRRANVAVLSRADMISESERDEIRRRVLRIAPEIAWAEVTQFTEAFLNASGKTCPIEKLQGKRVAAFCGLGNPAGFLGTLSSCGLIPVDFREFPDHHRYGKADIEQLIAWADKLSVDAILCTHKDLVKIDIDRLGTTPLWALTIGIRFLRGEETLLDRLPKSSKDHQI